MFFVGTNLAVNCPDLPLKYAVLSCLHTYVEMQSELLSLAWQQSRGSRMLTYEMFCRNLNMVKEYIGGLHKG